MPAQSLQIRRRNLGLAVLATVASIASMLVCSIPFILSAHAAPSHQMILEAAPPGSVPPPSAIPTDTNDVFLPVVLAPRQRAELVSVADGHVCVLTADRKVQCWGMNDNGQLGQGSTGPLADAPVSVVGLDDPVSHLSAGGSRWSERHGLVSMAGRACAVTSAGILECWGAGFEPEGMVVTVLAGGVADVATGSTHACALMADGTVRCWGSNFYGAVGDGTRDDRSAPVPVVGLNGPATAITAGYYLCIDCAPYMTMTFGHTCALIQNGDVQCWGYNREGQLGNGKSGSSGTGEVEYAIQPVKVINLGARAVQVRATQDSTCALLENRAVKCWGLGYGATPQQIHGLVKPIQTLYDGCGTDTLGGLQCWQGYPAPAAARVDLPAPVATYAKGVAVECMTAMDGSVWCNGYNGNGELGNGQGGLERPQPVPVYGLAHGVTATAGTGFACAIVQDGGVRCWGQNEMGQLGDGSTYGSTIPVSTKGLPHVAQISAGVAHVCARTNEGGVACWGANDRQQIGGGAIITNTVPFTIAGLAGVSKLAAGGNHTCAVPGDGDLRCWGDNSFGQLGTGDLATYSQPRTVSGLAGPIAAVGAGAEHTCALLQSGAVQCWGGNQFAQLGIGTQTLSETVPITVTGLASGVTGLAVGAYHTCAVVAGGKVQCWGAKAATYIGSPGSEAVTVPLEVAGIEDVVELAAGGTKYDYYPPFGGVPPPLTTRVDARTCAISGSGSVQCWQMGEETPPAKPEDLDQGTAGVAVGAEFACAVMDVGGVRCWGKNDVGQLGNASPWSPFWVSVTGF